MEVNVKTSRYISYILRHDPESAGIALDEHGWANVGELIAAVNKRRKLDMEMLEEIVRTDDKQRYSFSEDKTLIRANQGHSFPVDVELERITPPDVLYHGTAERFAESIDATGLIPMSRLYVHLSGDMETAVNVGKRHGEPFVYKVEASRMHADGYEFYRSVNGVYLTKSVPKEYLMK